MTPLACQHSIERPSGAGRVIGSRLELALRQRRTYVHELGQRIGDERPARIGGLEVPLIRKDPRGQAAN